MTVVLDAFGLIALLEDEAAADDVAQLLEDGRVAMASINYAEALDRAGRRHGNAGELLRQARTALRNRVSIVALNTPLAEHAASLRTTHYGSHRRAVSLADCVCAATARHLDAAVATADRALLDLCAEEGIAVVELPR